MYFFVKFFGCKLENGAIAQATGKSLNFEAEFAADYLDFLAAFMLFGRHQSGFELSFSGDAEFIGLNELHQLQSKIQTVKPI